MTDHIEELNIIYNKVLHTKSELEQHNWCRQMRRYDSIIVAETIKELQTIANNLYVVLHK